MEDTPTRYQSTFDVVDAPTGCLGALEMDGTPDIADASQGVRV